MLTLLQRGWAVEVIPLTVGIRGSFHEPCWLEILHNFGISSQGTQSRFLLDLTRRGLEELDRMYGVRSEALSKLLTR